jgi:hypothetical protein
MTIAASPAVRVATSHATEKQFESSIRFPWHVVPDATSSPRA